MSYAGTRARRVLLPIGLTALGILAWHFACVFAQAEVFPDPYATWLAFGELVDSQRLWGDVIASLFRVTWGFLLAAAVGIPLGLVVGWSTVAFAALNPIIQGLRPISPIAWIPIAILWFGIGDGAGIYLIFLASFFPITVSIVPM